MAQSTTLRTGVSEDAKVFAADKCTAIAVSAQASTTGSPMTTHTADCAECDWRVNKVPAMDWPAGSMRPIYVITGTYPRQVRDDRGETWSKANLENMPQKREWEKLEGAFIIGYIPQVNHTFALIEGMYGIMNEHGVAMGESTCAAKLYAAPISEGGKALLEISELSQIGLERGRTAREAIQIMGDLAQEFGYYSAEWNTHKYGEAYAMGEGGEALTVVDTKEAWMFHIVPDDTGASAVWVAQRVPEGHITLVANSFVIRDVIPNHPDFMYSANLWEVAERKGWWSSSQGLLNFVKTYAPQRYHPAYSNLRVWRGLSLAAPDRHLPPETDAYADDYPFSVQVSRPEGAFSPRDIMWMQRDHYEGTAYSTAEGLAAGPFGDPNRFDLWSNGNMTVWDANEGEFPRTISLFRTSYSFVAEPRSDLPKEFNKLWLAEYAPDSSVYVPMYIQSESLPKSWISGTMQKYDSSSAWWNFCVVGNYAARFYKYAMQPVRTLQNHFEEKFTKEAASLEQSLLSQPKEKVKKALTEFTLDAGEIVSHRWRDLFPEILTTYRDGYVIGGQHNVTVTITRMFYPKWWLQTVGFFNNPPNRDGILFATNPALSSTASQQSAYMLVVALTCFLIGWLVGRRTKGNRHNYIVIPDQDNA